MTCRFAAIRRESNGGFGPEIGAHVGEMVVELPAPVEIVANDSLRFEPMNMLKGLLLSVIECSGTTALIFQGGGCRARQRTGV